MRYTLMDDESTQVPQEGYIGKAARLGGRTLARSAESILGLPGDIATLGLEGLNWGYNKLTGDTSPAPSSWPLPTSHDIRENVTKKLTGELLEPETSGEKFWDDVVSDVATMVVPGKNVASVAKAIPGAAARSTLGNLAQWGAQSVTESPLIGTSAKLGTMMLAGTYGGRKHLKNVMNENYSNAKNNLTSRSRIAATDLINNVKQMGKKFGKDHPDAKYVAERIQSLENAMPKKSTTIPVSDIIDLKQNWNKRLYHDKDLHKDTRLFLENANKELRKTIAEYGNKNKKFGIPYAQAEELYGALNGTNAIYNIFAQHPTLQKTIKNPITKTLIMGGIGFGGKHLMNNMPLLAGIGVGALGARETARAFQLLSKSPAARELYKGYINAALKSDTKAMAKYLTKLDSEADKNMPELYEKNSGRYSFMED